MRISAPPFLNPCYYGTDIDSREHLIACHHTVEEISKIIGADSLGYLSVESAKRLACGVNGKGYCTACFDGAYPTEIPSETHKNRFEEKISKARVPPMNHNSRSEVTRRRGRHHCRIPGR